MFWLLGNRLQSYIRHLRWTLLWSVPAWNLRDRRAKQYKRLRKSPKSYRRQTVWGVPGWPCGSINLVASGVGRTKRFSGDGCLVGANHSGWHHKALSGDLLVQSLGFTERRLVSERGVADASELVGQRTGGLVVVRSTLHIQCPSANATDLALGRLSHLGRSQHAPGAVREQHAQIAVATLGDLAQEARTARRVLARRQAEPAGKVARVLEVRHIARSGRHQRGGCEQTDAGNREQGCAGRAQAGQCGELALQLRDARFEQADFFHQQAGAATDQLGHGRSRIGQHTADRFQPG